VKLGEDEMMMSNEFLWFFYFYIYIFFKKVTDFGLSKETPKNAKGQFQTTLGTGPFMAPLVFFSIFHLIFHSKFQ
jgi:serine/threonine protein kinase